MLVDTHCHLDFPDLAADREGVLARAAAAGVVRMVTISTHVSRVATYRAIAEAHAPVFFSVGVHPHHADAEGEVTVDQLLRLSDHPKCVAIGEAGLDFHYDRSSREAQARGLRIHARAAAESGLPLVIHARAADDAVIAILRTCHREKPFAAVLHCFSSGEELARVGLDLGFVLSISGIATFKASEALRAIFRAAPRDRLVVETDAPYLAPVPHRGSRNEPAYVAKTAAFMAADFGMAEEAFARQTTENAFRLFPRLAPAGMAHAA